MSIQQFLDELHNLYRVTKSMISEAHTAQSMTKNNKVCLEIKEMIDFIEDNINEDFYFLKLYHLSTIFQVISFNDKVVYDVIKYFVSKNVELGISDSKQISHHRENQGFKFSTIQEYYIDLLPDDIMQVAETSEEDQKKFSQKKEDFFPGKLNHELYTILNKQETLNETDINKVRECLKHLFFKEKVVQQVVRHMQKIKEKSSKQEKDNIPLKKYTYKVQNTIEYITDKVYKKLQKRLKEYYNSYTLEVKKPMDYETLLEMSTILYQLGYEEVDVKRFIETNLKEAVSLVPMIGSFSQYYDKLNYYYSAEELNDVKAILCEMMICSNAEYVEWKELFEKEFKEKQKVLVAKGDYELARITKKS